MATDEDRTVCACVDLHEAEKKSEKSERLLTDQKDFLQLRCRALIKMLLEATQPSVCSSREDRN